MWETLLDALVDSAKTIPFLLVIYIIIELLEDSDNARIKALQLLNGKTAPLIAGGVGLIPQCGFSVMATNLYVQDYIKTGTLIAFFVATSDEALPLLLASSETIGIVWKVVVIKIVYAVVIGYVVNLFDKRSLATSFTINEEGCCHHELHHKQNFWGFIKHPLLHTLKVFLFIFIVNVVFGLLMFFAEDFIVSTVQGLYYVQPVLAVFIGLIPNCSSSVVLTGMYTNGILSFGALVGGLVTNSGIALAILLKDTAHTKRNLLVVGLMVLFGLIIGYGLLPFENLW